MTKRKKKPAPREPQGVHRGDAGAGPAVPMGKGTRSNPVRLELADSVPEGSPGPGEWQSALPVQLRHAKHYIFMFDFFWVCRVDDRSPLYRSLYDGAARAAKDAGTRWPNPAQKGMARLCRAARAIEPHGFWGAEDLLQASRAAEVLDVHGVVIDARLGVHAAAMAQMHGDENVFMGPMDTGHGAWRGLMMRGSLWTMACAPRVLIDPVVAGNEASDV